MDGLMDLLNMSPTLMALLGAHFIVYAPLGWAFALIRLCRRLMSRREVLVFAAFVVAILAEGVLLHLNRSWFSRRSTWGLPRYFGVFAPLLWIWVAKAVSDLWGIGGPRGVRLACRAAICLFLAWITVGVAGRNYRMFYTESGMYDVQVAAERIAPVIRADYRGPSVQTEVKRKRNEYFTSRRPVVFSDMGAAAWLVRGQSEGPMQRGCPYADDYLFIRVGSGYRNIEEVDSKAYDYVCDVPGNGTTWRLFRRKVK